MQMNQVWLEDENNIHTHKSINQVEYNDLLKRDYANSNYNDKGLIMTKPTRNYPLLCLVRRRAAFSSYTDSTLMSRQSSRCIRV